MQIACEERLKNIDSLTEINSTLNDKIRQLEEMETERTTVISGLALACDERLSTINQLTAECEARLRIIEELRRTLGLTDLTPAET